MRPEVGGWSVLDRITPVVLTLDESPNIGRTLSMLGWARRIVVVDSGSNDETVAIARGIQNVDVRQRAFDTHARQWTFAIDETGIDTEWILALDADYVISEEFTRELENLSPSADTGGYRAAFTYCIFGRPLQAALYPPVTVLFRRERARYVQDGHTQRVVPEGRIRSLRSRILHDDRKPLGAWLRSQDRYMRIEAEHLHSAHWGELGWPDRARKSAVLGAPLMFLYCVLVKGCWRDGWVGWYYVLLRVTAETILSLHLIERFVAGDELNW